MANRATADFNGNRSSGFAIGGSLLALAPAALMTVGPFNWIEHSPIIFRAISGQMSSASVSEITMAERDPDVTLRQQAAVAFRDLLGRQSDIEPEIAEVIYAKRSSLYAKF